MEICIVCIIFIIRCIWDIRTQQMISRLKSPCGCGSALDCRYCKETGSLFCGYDNGDVAIWGN